MRALIQRVSQANVTVDRCSIGEIGAGLLIFLGISPRDAEQELKMLAEKIVNLRIFEDSEGKMNLSLLDVKGSACVVSQFTLYADLKKGRRPSFIDAAKPEIAEPMYKKFIQILRDFGITTAEGEFGAHMMVSLINDGPVTLWIDSEELKRSEF